MKQPEAVPVRSEDPGSVTPPLAWPPVPPDDHVTFQQSSAAGLESVRRALERRRKQKP